MAAHKQESHAKKAASTTKPFWLQVAINVYKPEPTYWVYAWDTDVAQMVKERLKVADAARVLRDEWQLVLQRARVDVRADRALTIDELVSAVWNGLELLRRPEAQELPIEADIAPGIGARAEGLTSDRVSPNTREDARGASLTDDRPEPFVEELVEGREERARPSIGDAIEALRLAKQDGQLTKGDLRALQQILIPESTRDSLALAHLPPIPEQLSKEQRAAIRAAETEEFRDEVLGCQMDYRAAFSRLKAATALMGDEPIILVFQSYLDELHRLLEQDVTGRGHFGSLEANRGFAMALNEVLDQLNVRLSTEAGPATLLVTTRGRGAAETGYFQLNVTSVGMRGSSAALPRLLLCERPPRKKPKASP